MPAPVIVPPPPTVQQPSRPDQPVVTPKAPDPTDRSPGIDKIQGIFDQVFPEKGVKQAAKPAETKEPPPPVEPQKPERPVVERKPAEVPPPEPQKAEENKLPSFLQEALKVEKPKISQETPPETDVAVEWDENLPPDQKQSRIKGLREAYKRVKTELDGLKSRPQVDGDVRERNNYLERANQQMAEMLSRVSVENSPEFQQQILRPLYASWQEATRIVKEAGGDPTQLRAAMSMTGKAQFEALDELFEDMPDSAKAEAHDALRNYRRYDQARAAALADAPRTHEALRQRESQRQYQEMGAQRNQMKQMFENALTALRDEAKVEVFLKTNDPETKWWNDQGDRLIEQARSLFLENTDLNKVAFACLLAPAADAYRNLFMKAQKEVASLKEVIKNKGWEEPTLSESSGNAGNLTPEAQTAADLKRPFTEVFLREFHKSQAQNRR